MQVAVSSLTYLLVSYPELYFYNMMLLLVFESSRFDFWASFVRASECFDYNRYQSKAFTRGDFKISEHITQNDKNVQL